MSASEKSTRSSESIHLVRNPAISVGPPMSVIDVSLEKLSLTTMEKKTSPLKPGNWSRDHTHTRIR